MNGGGERNRNMTDTIYESNLERESIWVDSDLINVDSLALKVATKI